MDREEATELVKAQLVRTPEGYGVILDPLELLGAERYEAMMADPIRSKGPSNSQGIYYWNVIDYLAMDDKDLPQMKTQGSAPAKFEVGEQVLFDQPHILDFAGQQREQTWVPMFIAEVSTHGETPSYKVQESPNDEPSWVYFPEKMFRKVADA